MRTLTLALLAAALLVTPVIAAPTATTANAIAGAPIHLGTLDLATGKITASASHKAPGDIIWDNTSPLPNFRNQQGSGDEILDEGDLPDGTIVGAINIGFVTDSIDDVIIRYGFYPNDNFNTVGAPFATLNGGVAVYDITVTGLVGGGLFAYTLDVTLDDPFTITGPDIDAVPGTDWGWGFTILDPGDGTAMGPLIAGEGPDPVGAPGRADIFDRFNPPAWDGAPGYIGTFFFGGAPFAQFHMQLTEGAPLPDPVVDVPTADMTGLLALIGLLGLAGFVIVRRYA